ncbi:MAG: tetratricopeptide repeat protein [Gemmatimonadetes bacterium]|nr:tetratricopeptide repeat protein [Gemmatimonadota bacterium]
MSLAAKHRRQAAHHEQRQQHELALAEYIAAIREDDAARAEVDVALLNKVGDLALRLGRIPESVAFYERAVGSYVAAGRYNNAIALCNKVLKAAPGRAATYLTLGRICAEKGLRNDAARNFLEYATRMQQDGRMAEAGHALREVAELFSDLPELRRLVAELGAPLPEREEGGSARPVTPPSSPAAPRGASGVGVPSAPRQDGLVFLDVGPSGAGPSGTGPMAAGDAPALTAEPQRAPQREQGDTVLPGGLPSAPERIDGLERSVPMDLVPTTPDDLWDASFLVAPLEGIEVEPSVTEVTASSLEELLVEEPLVDALTPSAARSDAGVTAAPPFRLDPHDFILAGELPPLRLEDALADRETVVADASGSLAPAQAAELGADAAGSPLDLMEGDIGVGPYDAVPEAAVDALDAAVEAVAAPSDAPRSWQALRDHAEALLGAGAREAGLAALSDAIDVALAAADSDAAVSTAELLVRVSPDRMASHQRRLEVVIGAGDAGRLREAYLDLADALVRQGDDAGARAVYARVLVLNPGEHRARSALGLASGAARGAVAGESAVRIRVPEPESTGDDTVDFEVLLRRFKDGVARSLGDDDYGSRYDLGVAFKEMGLLDDAVAEFQKALRSPAHRLPAYEALGQCFVEQGRHQVAITLLSRALLEPLPAGQDERQRVGMRYLLAYANEALQRRDEARSHYQRVSQIDRNFRDVTARLAALGAGPS